MKNYLQFKEQEITVYCGENARINTKESLKQALDIIKAGKGNVLYVNTIFTTRKLYQVAREVLGAVEHTGLHYHNVIMGDLQKHFSVIQEVIEKENIKTIIISAWEFANNGYVYREKALFQLKHYAEALGLSVIVYSQARCPHQTGKMDRGGIGKLAVIAALVLEIETKELEREERESEILSKRKINELGYARSESGISAGGELILPGREVEKEILEEELVM